MKKLLVITAILICVNLQAQTYDFVIDNLLYSVISTNPPKVCLKGHQDGTNATGELVIPESVSYEGITYSVTRIGEKAFKGCENLTGPLTIPGTIKEIEKGAFRGCSGFTGDLVIPNSVVRIGLVHDYSDTIGPYYGNGAFQNCSGFDGHLMLSDSLSYICPFCFQGCNHLIGDLIIPESVSTICEIAFLGCSGFNGCLILPDGLEAIGRECFEVCSGFTGDLIIPNSVTSIGMNAFAGSGFDGQLVLSERMTKITDGVFYECNFVGTLTIPNAVNEIQSGAFSGCGGFTYLHIGDSISRIHEDAFVENNIQSMSITAQTPPELWGGYPRLSREMPVYVPFLALDAYHNAPKWDEFTNIQPLQEWMGYIDGAEWYYEIENEDGSITYQHLQCAGDTIVGNQRPKIIVRSNTQYDKDVPTEVTHEYVYEENGIVYWWNKDLDEFTTLYNLNAETGDEWTIKVGYDSLVMHVDGVEDIEYEGQIFRLLHVSDPDDLFSGDIVCGIGHLTSFFPERLMRHAADYTVNGMRCYWVNGDLFFKIGDEDCDAVYQQYHDGIDENGLSTGSGTEEALVVYPNPANNTLFVETRLIASLPATTYHITNLLGQTLLQGNITVENQQIDISSLPAGMYFISMGGQTAKFVVR